MLSRRRAGVENGSGAVLSMRSMVTGETRLYNVWGWRLGVRAEICTSGVQNDEQKMRREISPRQGKRRKKDGD